mmetsp:Transcript_9235/g.7005  ORF Transcript_9235/g.7005 Transcript_9235/m.7005 type:complete len:124 (+) Transcript_9235:635-1006(+)
MLSSETKVVTYVNKKGERSTYPLSSAMESANLEMVKRLKYTKDILTHMLNNNNNPQSSKPGGPETLGSMSTNPNMNSQSSRPKTNAMGAGDPKFSATDRIGKAYSTSQGFNPSEGGNGGGHMF